MILELVGVTHYYGADLILKDVGFRVDERDRIGIVGYNGCGKTTLLNIITGELEPSEGAVVLKDGATIGYQKQAVGLNPENTVLSEMKTVNDADSMLQRMRELERSMGDSPELLKEYEILSSRYETIGGYELDYRIKKVLNGMSFREDTYDKKVSVLSGGERTRLAFSKLLISHPDVLVLDEPTNHLDAETLEWLESFLSSYSGAVITVSHDRWFLDRVVTKILEIVNHKAKLYNGNYSAFLQQREFNEIQAEKEYKERAETAEKLRDYAERNIVRASTSKMAKSRLKMLDRIDLEKPENLRHEKVRFDIEPAGEPNSEVLTIKDVTVKVKDRVLVQRLSYTLLRGERLAIVGPNGGGKTTLINVIAGKRKPDSGSVRVGGGVKKAYLEQNLYAGKTMSPIDYIWDRYPSMSQLQVRNLLAAVGFQGEEVFLAGSGLSGGELARLNLARISLEQPNLLILDEPTNHLDIYSKETLTETLVRYKGTMVVVTHDRYLLSQLDAKILYLDGKGNDHLFEDFDSYRAFLDRGFKEEADGESIIEVKPREVMSQKEQRRQKAQQRERISFLEENIEKIERQIVKLENEAAQPEIVSDHVRLGEIYEELEQLQITLAEYSDEWLRLE